MPYIGRTVDGFGVRNRFVYLASASDTSVSGADANGATLTFTDGAYVDVYLNGVLLKPGTDYNTTTANTIAGISAMAANDEVTVVVYDVFTVADTVSATSGGTFSGGVTVGSTLDVTGNVSLDGGGFVFNESGADKDFRVESDGNANMLFVDGGNNEVGIGTNTPSGHSSPNGAKLVVHGTSGATMIQINATASNQSSGIEFTDDAATGQIHYHHGSDSLTFTVNGTQHFSIASNGDLTATDTSISSISDERLKTNIKDYTYDLEVFKKFKPKTFDWKNPKEHGDKSNVRGFIAQDILDVDNVLVSQTDIEPQTAVSNLDAEADLISKDSDGKRLSYTSKLNGNDAMYISVIQQLITRIEALESK